jgi:magnesium-transporting ATPase (P-type)
MAKAGKGFLGVLTLWPLIYIFVFIAVVITQLTADTSDLLDPSGDSTDAVDSLLLAHLLTMALILGLLVFYVAHAVRSPRVPDNQRVLWAIFLVLGSMIAMPIYFWLYVWPDG